MAKPLLKLELGGGMFDEIERVQVALGIAAEAIPDMRAVNGDQRATLEGIIRKQFASEGAYLGAPWQQYLPNEPAYRGYKIAMLTRRAARTRTDARVREMREQLVLATYHQDKARAKQLRRQIKAARARLRRSNRIDTKQRIPLLRWVLGSTRQGPQPGEVLYPSFFFGDRNNFWASYPDGFEWGSRVPYARKHQRGLGTQKWDKRPIPKRAILIPSHRRVRGALVRNIQAYVHQTLMQVTKAAPGITLETASGLVGMRPPRAGLRDKIRRTLR